MSEEDSDAEVPFVRLEEFMELEATVALLADSVTLLRDSVDKHLQHMDLHMNNLIKVASGQTPDKCVPMETHHLVIKTLCYVYIVTLFAAVGAVKFLPVITKT